jgi:hypothetical protein
MEGIPQELQFELKDENELLHNMEKNSEEPSIDMEIIEEPVVDDVVELDVPEIKKEPIKSEDIFLTPEVPKPEKPVRLNKNGQPRKKRQYTEEQREAMRVRMLKAREARGKNDKIKKEKKEKEKKHKELKEKTIEHEIEEMEQKLTKKNNPQSQPQPKQSFTKEDIQDAQLNAIVEYEKIRKQRKQKKKQEQLIAQEKEALKNLVKREMNQSWEATAGRFSGCY